MSKHGIQHMHQTITFTDGIEARSNHFKTKVCKSIMLHNSSLAQAKKCFMMIHCIDRRPATKNTIFIIHSLNIAKPRVVDLHTKGNSSNPWFIKYQTTFHIFTFKVNEKARHTTDAPNHVG